MEVIGFRDRPVRTLRHPSAPGRGGYLTTPVPREAAYAVGTGRVRAKKNPPEGAAWCPLAWAGRILFAWQFPRMSAYG